MNTFAERFKHARELANLSFAKVAERIDVSTQAVWNYENRPDGSVSVDLLFPLADALGVEARWLATGEGPMSPGEATSFEIRRAERMAKSLAVLTDEKLHALSVLLGVKL
ncbi:helix-turn-helix domain-containing protein (plasmid) [Massilia varians]